jgi:hypothetical protein
LNGQRDALNTLRRLGRLFKEIEAAKVSAVAQARNGGKGQGLGAGSETNALTQKGDLMRQQLAAMDKQRKVWRSLDGGGGFQWSVGLDGGWQWWCPRVGV